MLRLLAVSRFLVAATFISFGVSTAKATATTIFPFEATYNTQSVVEEVRPGISQITVTGKSETAPYGLTNLFSLSYGQLNLDTSELITTEDPARFGNSDLPFGENRIFSSNNDDSVFTRESVTRPLPIDFKNPTTSIFSTLNITGGSGRFNGATGTLNVSIEDTLTSSSTVLSKGRVKYSGSFQTPQSVTEPANTTALIGMGIFGASLLRRQRKPKVAV